MVNSLVFRAPLITDDLAAYSYSGNSQIEGCSSDYTELLLLKVGNIQRIIHPCSKLLKINKTNEEKSLHGSFCISRTLSNCRLVYTVPFSKEHRSLMRPQFLKQGQRIWGWGCDGVAG